MEPEPVKPRRFDLKTYKRARAISAGLQWLNGTHSRQLAAEMRAAYEAQKRSQLG